jgi:tetratricopeptide (TPR) repeat protein
MIGRNESNAKRLRDAAALTQQAVDLFFRGDYDVALNLVEDSLGLNPAYSRTHCAKALCLLQLGQARDALKCTEYALELNDGDAVAYTTRAMCRHRLGDGEGAEADFERAVELGPDDYRVFYNAACYWAERGREEECREHFETAMALAPAAFAAVAAADPDLARYSGREWFREILAEVRKRGI